MWSGFNFVALSLAVASVVAAQPCVPGWTGEFNMLMGEGHVLALHDPDGPGPSPARVFVGGDMNWRRPGGQDPLHFGIGMWDGRAITSAGWAGTESILDHDPDGVGPGAPRLYAAGWQGVEVWEGEEQWSQVGSKFNAVVRTLVSWDPDGPGPGAPLLIAGGEFTKSGNIEMLRVAAWDGSAWKPLGEGFDGPVLSLVCVDDDGDGVSTLAAGGSFTASGKTPLGPAARWVGGAWQPYPGKFSAGVTRLAAFDEDAEGPLNERLYAAGEFVTIDGAARDHIARFDGAAWLPCEHGLSNAAVDCLRTLDPDGPGPTDAVLYVASHSGGEWWQVGRVDAWDGEHWVAPEWTPTNPAGGDDGFWAVKDLLYADSDGDGPEPRQLVITGLLPSYPTRGHAMASWHDGHLWTVGEGLASGYGGNVIGSYTFSMAAWEADGAGTEPARLMVGGGFPGYLAGRERGRTFLAEPDLCCVTYDINWIWVPAVFSLYTWDNDGPGPRTPGLYAGILGSLRGFEDQQVVRLDRDGWSALGPDPTPLPWAMAAFDDDGPGPRPEALYIGGQFDQCGGVPAHSIARWDGHSWEALGPGVSGTVATMAVFDEDGHGPLPPALFVGGSFQSAGGIPANRIARWDGAQWFDVAGGISLGYGPKVESLVVYDEDGDGPGAAVLIVGGRFAQAGTSPTKNLARWDGVEWSEVGGGIGEGDYDGVAALTVADDDGPGPRPTSLFVGGGFGSAGGQPAQNFARWDGQAWERPPGTFGGITAMSAVDEDGDGPLPAAVYVGGAFTEAGGVSALDLARWGCDREPNCLPDCDRNGTLDLSDFVCFANAFAAGDGAADCDGSGGLDLFDFLCFTNAFNAGC